MEDTGILSGKKILVVDDEADVLETIKEQLSACDVTTASTFETAKEYLEKEKVHDCPGITCTRQSGPASECEIITEPSAVAFLPAAMIVQAWECQDKKRKKSTMLLNNKVFMLELLRLLTWF